MRNYQHFSAAAWDRTLKVVSFLGTALIAVVAYLAYRKISAFSGSSLLFGCGVVSIFPAILIFSLLFVVTGYAVEGNVLYVERLFWSTAISLEGLKKAWAEPLACRSSIRLFGNGGLYSFTGIYKNRRLGRYRLFGTDLTRSTVLVLQGRTVVVTPASPQVFIDYLHRQFPMIEEKDK